MLIWRTKKEGGGEHGRDISSIKNKMICVHFKGIYCNRHTCTHAHVCTKQTNTSANKSHVYASLNCNMRSCTSLECSPCRVNLLSRSQEAESWQTCPDTPHREPMRPHFLRVRIKTNCLYTFFAIYLSMSRKPKSKNLPPTVPQNTNEHVSEYEKPPPKN